VAAVCTAIAVALAARRDLGAGLLDPRPGRSAARSWLRGPSALALHQQRPAFLAWATGLAAMAELSGSFARTSQDMLEENPAIARLTTAGPRGATDAFLALMALALALAVGAAAVASMQCTAAEEVSGRVAAVLATPVGRTRWFLSVFSVTVAGAALLLVVAGLSLGVAVAVTLEEPRRALTVAGAVLVYLPAVVVLTGVAATFVGVGVRRFAVRDLG